MANAFGVDENCAAAFLFNVGAFTDDDVGENGLTQWYVYGDPSLQDTVTFAEGDASSYVEQYVNDIWYVTPWATDFPLRSGTPGGSESFSVTLWFYMSPTYESYYTIVYKPSSFTLGINYFPSDEPSYNSIEAYVYGDGAYDSNIPLLPDQWYHIAVTFDADTKELNLRVYDADTQDVATWSKTFAVKVPRNANQWFFFDYYGELEGNVDEVTFFSDVLTPAEIDQIRQGTYGTGEAGSGDAAANAFFGLSLGCPF